MTTAQVVSISELRTHRHQVLTSLSKWSKYIFVNNKPKAVLVSCEEYEYMKKLSEIYTLQAESDYAAAYWPRFTSGEDMSTSLKWSDDRTEFTEKNKSVYQQAKKEQILGKVISLEELKQKYAPKI